MKKKLNREQNEAKVIMMLQYIVGVHNDVHEHVNFYKVNDAVSNPFVIAEFKDNQKVLFKWSDIKDDAMAYSKHLHDERNDE